MSYAKYFVPVAFGALAACGAPSYSQAELSEQRADADRIIATFKERQPEIRRLFESSYAYAVLPTVGAGGVGVGGAYGEGIVYEQGRPVGTTNVTKFSLGPQLGGETMSEIIFFKTREDLRKFQEGDFAFDAGATAIALDEGVATAADFDDGVEVVVMAKKGLMAAATVGGQEFDYRPLPAEPR
jgi:lipid-binding SYLF domain-containing protein